MWNCCFFLHRILRAQFLATHWIFLDLFDLRWWLWDFVPQKCAFPRQCPLYSDSDMVGQHLGMEFIDPDTKSTNIMHKIMNFKFMDSEEAHRRKGIRKFFDGFWCCYKAERRTLPIIEQRLRALSYTHTSHTNTWW